MVSVTKVSTVTVTGLDCSGKKAPVVSTLLGRIRRQFSSCSPVSVMEDTSTDAVILLRVRLFNTLTGPVTSTVRLLWDRPDTVSPRSSSTRSLAIWTGTL